MSAPRPRLLFALQIIFLLSGFSSLVYQIVWQRMLTYLYGVGFVSVALIVAVYMFGLGFGALLGGRLADAKGARPLLQYFFIEISIGGFGWLSLPFLDFLLERTAGASYAVSAVYMCLFLSVPTLLMGATLPLLCKAFNSHVRSFGRTISRLYFINTLGAAFGALATSFFLITYFGLDGAVYAAACLNVLLAFSVLLVRRSAAEGPAVPPYDLAAEIRHDDSLGWKAYPVVFVTGFLAIGYELLWYRSLQGYLTGFTATSYAFPLLLAFYLVGVAFGSFGIEVLLRRRPQLSRADLLFFLQFLLAVLIPVSAVLAPNLVFDLGHPLARACVLLFLTVSIPTLFMGATFPLISSLSVTRSRGEGRTVGGVYFFNVLGNLLGGLATGLILLPNIGTERTFVLFSLVGVLFLLHSERPLGVRVPLIARAAVVLAVAAALGSHFPSPKSLLLRTLRWRNPAADLKKYPYDIEEGIGGVVVRYQEDPETMALKVDWLSQGDWPGYRFASRVLYGAPYCRKIDRALVVGFGVGKALEATLHTEVKRAVVIEVNPTLMKSLRKMPAVQKLLADPRVEFHLEDARRFLYRDARTYDFIVMASVRSGDAYSTNVQSHEFMSLVRRRLAPGGILVQWCTGRTVLPRTIADLFPYLFWYEHYVFASDRPFAEVNRARSQAIERGLGAAYVQALKEKVKGWGFLGDRDKLLAETRHIPLIRDRRPSLEYFIDLRYSAWYSD